MNVAGKFNAFQFELTLKSKERLQDKIRKFQHAILMNRGKADSFVAVYFITGNEASFQTLTNLTSPYPNEFKIEDSRNCLNRRVNAVSDVDTHLWQNEPRKPSEWDEPYADDFV